MPEGLSPDIAQLVRDAEPFDLNNNLSNVELKRQLTPFVAAGKKIFIKDTLIDAHTVISPDDSHLKSVIKDLVSELAAHPTICEVVDAIDQAYPRNSSVTFYTRQYRQESTQSKTLGEYFLPEEDVPYTAVCIHKALLAQALLSFYGHRSNLINFGFSGQIIDGMNDGKAGMHSVLRVNIEENQMTADPHKGIYESEADYFKRFVDPQLFDPLGTVVFTPEEQQ